MSRTITATLPAQRRQFLAALTGALVAPSIPAAAMASTDRIREAANALADAMAAAHQGPWKGQRFVAHIDHECGFILIQAVRSTGGAV